MPFFFDAAMSNPCEDVNTVSASVTSAWRPHPWSSLGLSSSRGSSASALGDTQERPDSCRRRGRAGREEETGDVSEGGVDDESAGRVESRVP